MRAKVEAKTSSRNTVLRPERFRNVFRSKPETNTNDPMTTHESDIELIYMYFCLQNLEMRLRMLLSIFPCNLF